jgi:hypothetical protein
MLSADEISAAKKRTKHHGEARHESDDCIRIAYEWLDAQKKTKGIGRATRPLKHIIEKWGGRYVSQADVEVAAELHPEIRGEYPHFNISSRLIRSSDNRLANIKEARTQNYSISENSSTYAEVEG